MLAVLFRTNANLLGTSLAPPWHLLGTSLAPPWHLLGTSCAPPFHLLGTSCAPPWHLLCTSFAPPVRQIREDEERDDDHAVTGHLFYDVYKVRLHVMGGPAWITHTTISNPSLFYDVCKAMTLG